MALKKISSVLSTARNVFSRRNDDSNAWYSVCCVKLQKVLRLMLRSLEIILAEQLRDIFLVFFILIQVDYDSKIRK